MNRSDIFFNLAQRARNAGDIFNALAIRFSGISLEAFGNDETLRNETRLSQAEERVIQNNQKAIHFRTQSAQFETISFEDLHAVLEINRSDRSTYKTTTPSENEFPEPRIPSPEPLPQVLLPTASYHPSPSPEGEPHEATPPVANRIPRAVMIRLDFHPSYIRQLPEEGIRIMHDFVNDGVNDANCMQLLQYFALTFKNLLTTVEKYLHPDQAGEVDMLTLNSEADLVRSFNPDLINIVYVPVNAFESTAKIIFPIPALHIDAEFSALYQPFRAMKKRRTYLYAHMMYLYLYVSRQFSRVFQTMTDEIAEGGVDCTLFDFLRRCTAKFVTPNNEHNWKWEEATIRDPNERETVITNADNVGLFYNIEENPNITTLTDKDERFQLWRVFSLQSGRTRSSPRVNYFAVAYFLRHVENPKDYILMCINLMENDEGGLWSLVTRNSSMTISTYIVQSILANNVIPFGHVDRYEAYTNYIPCAALYVKHDRLGS
ncbi:hypothetical protein EDC96DRAFT_581473 [Choanephora cucurbitarum]|nr:hypothetical protein EDC96DRAFT_581473 [Choanephora cucurbitarum]